VGKPWSTGGMRFNENQLHQIENNTNVLHVSDRSIAYQPAFKLAAVKSYHEGKTPLEIFVEAGFNVDIIGRENPNRCLKRWRRTYDSQGKDGLMDDQRGKGSTGRPVSNLSFDKKLEQAEARIKFLEAENDFLKKLEALEIQAEQRKR
jgi:transposase